MSTDARALIIVDVQNDFCEGGSLPVTGGAAVARRISEYVVAHEARYAAVVATADWHEDPGPHWAEEPDYIDSWPVHCRVGSGGENFHPEVAEALDHVQAVFRKGRHTAAYSGFEGVTREGDRELGLGQWLREHDIHSVDVVGLTTDYCVRATALDATGEGLATAVLRDLTAGVAPDTTKAALSELAAAGVAVRDSAT